MFFFAFLPQFVDRQRGHAAVQVLYLGVLFVLLGVGSDSRYAVLAGSAGKWLRGNLRFLEAQRYLAGGALIVLGVIAAVVASGDA